MSRPAAERAVVIAASAGGLDAISIVLGGLRAGFAAPVLALLHSAAGASTLLSELLARRCRLPVTEARAGMQVRGGEVYLAPSDYHLLVERDGRLALNVDDKVSFVRPSADVLFASAAEVWRQHLVCVVLTGSNHDGAAGMQAVRMHRGQSVIQDPASAAHPEMPRAACGRPGEDVILPLAQIAPHLNQWDVRHE
jgi:two-component system, chemotaxis family, protein-glutamate methylesterase/glutaminase